MYVVAITGASGVIYGIRLIEELLSSGKEVSAIVSDAAWKIIHFELFHNCKKPSTMKEIISLRGRGYHPNNLKEYNNKNLFSPIASGTSRFEAVVIIPCSMKTLSGISSGYADSLISRVADVALKERRRLILVPRETPLNLIHLENMLKAGNAGADILIPAPSFYTFPVTVDDMINYIVGKALDLLNIEHSLFERWGKGE